MFFNEKDKKLVLKQSRQWVNCLVHLYSNGIGASQKHCINTSRVIRYIYLHARISHFNFLYLYQSVRGILKRQILSRYKKGHEIRSLSSYYIEYKRRYSSGILFLSNNDSNSKFGKTRNSNRSNLSDFSVTGTQPKTSLALYPPLTSVVLVL